MQFFKIRGEGNFKKFAAAISLKFHVIGHATAGMPEAFDGEDVARILRELGWNETSHGRSFKAEYHSGSYHANGGKEALAAAVMRDVPSMSFTKKNTEIQRGIFKGDYSVFEEEDGSWKEVLYDKDGEKLGYFLHGRLTVREYQPHSYLTSSMHSLRESNYYSFALFYEYEIYSNSLNPYSFIIILYVDIVA